MMEEKTSGRAFDGTTEAWRRKKKKKTQDLREKIGLEVLTGVDKVDFTNKLKIHRCPSGFN